MARRRQLTLAVLMAAGMAGCNTIENVITGIPACASDNECASGSYCAGGVCVLVADAGEHARDAAGRDSAVRDVATRDAGQHDGAMPDRVAPDTARADAAQPDATPQDAAFVPSAAYCLTSQCIAVTPTEQTTCYNWATPWQSVSCPGVGGDGACGATPGCGQDAQYTRSPRSFYCYNASAQSTPCANLPTASTDEVVTDSVTGLMWQRTTTTETWQGALDYCNSLNYGGHDDWRLPNPFELESIALLGRNDPAVDPVAFPGTALNWTWTSAESVAATANAWSVALNMGYVSPSDKTLVLPVRCVRRGLGVGTGAAAQRYRLDGTVANELTVLDRGTDLEWQKASTTATYTWQQALASCESLSYGGHTDWRLPSQRELMSLLSYARTAPASDFPDMFNYYFWSSTTSLWLNTPDQAWAVNFSTGNVGDFIKSGVDAVRCVRGP